MVTFSTWTAKHVKTTFFPTLHQPNHIWEMNFYFLFLLHFHWISVKQARLNLCYEISLEIRILSNVAFQHRDLISWPQLFYSNAPSWLNGSSSRSCVSWWKHWVLSRLIVEGRKQTRSHVLFHLHRPAGLQNPPGSRETGCSDLSLTVCLIWFMPFPGHIDVRTLWGPLSPLEQ